MNARQKEVLASCRVLLTRNVIWTTQLTALLKEQGVLSDAMLADIEAAPERHDKIRLLLDLLPLRGSQSYEKFCDVLHLTGHLFLADFLREEEVKKEAIDLSDLYRRLPSVGKCLKEQERKQLEGYIVEKLQSETMKVMWKRDTKEKEKWLDTKQKQLTEAQEFEEERKTASDRISHLQDTLEKTQDALVQMRAEKRVLERQMTELMDSHKEKMNVQIKYNAANDAEISRSNKKLAKMESMMKTIHNKINDLVGVTPREDERDLMTISENPVHFLGEDFDLFVSHFRKLLEVKRDYERLLEERNMILLHLGYSPDNEETPSLLLAFKDFAVKNDENINNLRQEISRYGNLLKEKDTKLEDLEDEDSKSNEKSVFKLKQATFSSGAAVWQAAIMTVMRKQLNDLKIDVRKKTTQLTMQEDEITKHKSKIKSLEKQLQKLKERQRDQEQFEEARQTIQGHMSGSPDSIDAKVEQGRHSSMLPPIRFGQIQTQSYSPIPRQLGFARKHHASIPRGFNSEGPIVGLPEGLNTAQLRLENRPRNQMTNVLGDLKSLHNRHRASAFNDRNNMTVIGKGESKPR